jgi:hypothetical protein
MRFPPGILAIAATLCTASYRADAEPPLGAVYSNLDRNC